MVTYRRPDDLPRSLERLAAQTVQPATVWVIDNADEPATARICDESGLDVHYVSAGSNLGPAGGLRMGIDLALDDGFEGWVLLLDDDNPPAFDDAIERSLMFVEFASGKELVAGVALTGARFDRRRGRIARIPDAELQGLLDVDYLPGNHYPMYRSHALRGVESPDPSLFFGYEELDLGLALKAAGWRLVVNGDHFLELRRHYGTDAQDGRSSRSGRPDSPWRRYYSTRNILLVLSRRSTSVTMVRASARMVAGAFERLVRRTEGAGALWKSTLAGLLDGWAGVRGLTVDPGGQPRPLGHARSLWAQWRSDAARQG
jgi:rhamnopyranosyl-N-acetylglucosaminyl-diphospho-decaprenol beta-1,3/1,4-galactofuranosyltransferase